MKCIGSFKPKKGQNDTGAQEADQRWEFKSGYSHPENIGSCQPKNFHICELKIQNEKLKNWCKPYF
jgi:hypothetical protein